MNLSSAAPRVVAACRREISVSNDARFEGPGLSRRRVRQPGKVHLGWLIGTLASIVGGMLLLGCGDEYVDSPPPTPVALEAPACLGNVPPEPVRLPKDFHPVEALVCGEKLKGSPRQAPGPYLQTVHRGDFTAAIEVLGRRDRKRETCDASTIGLPEVWLINAAGQGLIPRYPLDECGQPNLKGLNAILDVPVVSQQRLTAPPA
ncbi:hypothetical protein WIMU106979_24955 [Williamsia muralis]